MPSEDAERSSPLLSSSTRFTDFLSPKSSPQRLQGPADALGACAGSPKATRRLPRFTVNWPERS